VFSWTLQRSNPLPGSVFNYWLFLLLRCGAHVTVVLECMGYECFVFELYICQCLIMKMSDFSRDTLLIKHHKKATLMIIHGSLHHTSGTL